MNKQQDSKGKKTSYRQQQDYGQYEYSKKYKEEDKPNKDYEIYEKEDYSQYIQKNEEDKYYYEGEEYDEQNQQQHEQNQQESNNFEEVPNIKKILAKKSENGQKTKMIYNNVQQNINQDGSEDDNQYYQQSNDDQDEQDENYDEQNTRNNYQNQQKQHNQTKATKKVFKKYEEQGLSDNDDGQEEEDDQQNYNDEEEQNFHTKQINKQQNQQQNTGGVLKNSKQNQIKGKSMSNRNIQDEDDEEEEDPEKETDYPEQSNQTQQSSKSENSNNYMRNTKSFQTKQEIKQGEKTLSQLSEPFDNIYNTKKYPLGIVDDPALEEERKNLWKMFGRECAAGRELFSLYKCHMPPKISYPKPKQKTAEELMPKPKEVKPCPQKTQISYPPLSYKEPKQKYYKVDFIPKRKPEAEIRKELEEIARNPYIPANTGKNRKDLIEKLQQKFKYLRGGLPKGAELPLIDENKIACDEEIIKAQAKKRIGMKNKIFTGEYEDRNDQKTVISDDPVQECNTLFDQIMQEIEERQEYLESIKDLKEPKLKTKIKKEIIERVAELQKVTELKQKYM